MKCKIEITKNEFLLLLRVYVLLHPQQFFQLTNKKLIYFSYMYYYAITFFYSRLQGNLILYFIVWNIKSPSTNYLKGRFIENICYCPTKMKVIPVLFVISFNRWRHMSTNGAVKKYFLFWFCYYLCVGDDLFDIIHTNLWYFLLDIGGISLCMIRKMNELCWTNLFSCEYILYYITMYNITSNTFMFIYFYSITSFKKTVSYSSQEALYCKLKP